MLVAPDTTKDTALNDDDDEEEEEEEETAAVDIRSSLSWRSVLTRCGNLAWRDCTLDAMLPAFGAGVVVVTLRRFADGVDNACSRPNPSPFFFVFHFI